MSIYQLSSFNHLILDTGKNSSEKIIFSKTYRKQRYRPKICSIKDKSPMLFEIFV